MSSSTISANAESSTETSEECDSKIDSARRPSILSEGCRPNNDNEKNEKKNAPLFDATQLFLHATEGLSHNNPFIHNASFTLYDSMSALELTDAKMDSCEIPLAYYSYQHYGNNETCRSHTGSTCEADTTQDIHSKETNQEHEHKTVPPRPLPTHLHSLPWKKISLAQTKHIVLQLMSQLYSYLNGTSLAESIFTCYYLHSPLLQSMAKCARTSLETMSNQQQHEQQEQVDNDKNDDNGVNDVNEHEWAQSLLSLMCHLIYWNAKLIRKIVLHGDIYEEEDFTSNPYTLLPMQQQQDQTESTYISIKEIRSHMDVLQRQLRQQTKLHASVDLQIIFRCIQFLIDFHTINYNLSCQLTKSNVVALTMEMKSLIDTNCMENSNRLVELIQGSNSDITNNGNNSNDGDDKGKNEILFATFDPYLNRHLLGNSPVRNAVSSFRISALDTIQSLHIIVQEVSFAVCELILNGTDLNKIGSILHTITSTNLASTIRSTTTKMAKPNTATNTSKLNILSRSLLVINLYFSDLLFGQHTLPIVISNNIKEYYNVPSTLIQQTEYGVQLLSRLCKPIYDTIKVFLLNKSRQRLFIENVMFREWNFLLQEAALVDHCFHKDFLSGSGDSHASSNQMTPFISNYILTVIIELMERHLSVGIEVGLFTGCWHLLSAYWYLDFLASTRLSILTSMRDRMKERKVLEQSMIMEEAQNSIQTNDIVGGGGGKLTANSNKGKKKGKKSKKCQSKNHNDTNGNHIDAEKDGESAEDHLDILVLKMKRLMYRGIVRVS